MKGVFGIVGLLLGLGVAYLSRPTYLGGLVDPVANGQVDSGIMRSWGPTLVIYGLIGLIAGAVIGSLLEKKDTPR